MKICKCSILTAIASGYTGRDPQGGFCDRSINSSYSYVMLTSSSLLKNEKKKKKINPEVISGEGDENDDEKIKEK